MTSLHKLLRRIGLFWKRRRLERDLEEEVTLHLENKINENLGQGMTAQEARRRALVEFGNPFLSRERSREEWSYRWLGSVLQDLHYAVRQLRKRPGFAAVAVFMLAFGIGANTAIFSVVYAVLLRPLPYQEPSRLVDVGSDTKEAGDGISYEHYKAWRAQSHSFEALAVYYRNSGWSRVTLTGDEPESAQGIFASANVFQVLGVAPAQGRVFTPEEEQRRERVVLISDGLCRRRFGGSASALGQWLQVNGQNFQVIGVMPAVFQFPARDVQFWAPITTNQYWDERTDQVNVHGNGADGFHWRWVALGRLKPAASPASARKELEAIGTQWQHNPMLEIHGASVVPLHVEVAPNQRLALYVLLGAVTLVLLIACSNLANLMLASGVSRAREMAVRAALGAPRRRLVRQVLTESLLLALISGFAGLLLSRFGERALIAFGPADLPRLEQTGLGAAVFGFTLIVSALSAILFGLAPALKISGASPAEALKSCGQSLAVSFRRNRTSAALVATEVGLSFLLLSGAGLLIRSFLEVEKVDPGFQTDHVLTVHIRPGSNVLSTHDQLLERLKQIPGVKAVGAIDQLLAQDDPEAFGVRAVDGKDIEAWGKWSAPLAWNVVSGDVLGALGVELIKGRYFSSQDGPDTPPVVLIDQSMAKRYWPGQNPVGQRLKGWDPRGHCTPSGCKDEWVTVIGVVTDMRRRGRERQPVADIFQWYRQNLPGNPPPGDFVIRTRNEPESLPSALRAAIHEVDRSAVISDLATLDARLDAQIAPRRFQTWLLALFALAAVMLAGLGIYSVMHYVVAQRTRELGICIALGAQAGDVFKLVIGEGLRVTFYGLIAGSLAAFAFTRVLKTLLFGVGPADPATMVTVIAVLCVTAIAACYVPARRATKVDPLIALRHE